MTRTSGMVVVAQVVGGRWERRAGGGEVMAQAVDNATGACRGHANSRAVDKTTREGGERWHQARTREDGGRQ